MELKNIENVQLVAWFIVPGLVVLYTRAQFLNGRMPVQANAILPCLALSMVCFVIGQPIQQYMLPPPTSEAYLASTLIVLFVVPALLGVWLGLSAKYDLGRCLLHKIGLKVVHQVPCAWDWKFSNTPNGAWVLVTLTDGTQFAGLYGGNSFASSDTEERDVYIQQVWTANDGQAWTPRSSGVLILASSISAIEFWEYNRQEVNNVGQGTTDPALVLGLAEGIPAAESEGTPSARDAAG